MKKIIQDEEGSIIASVVLLTILSSVLLLGMTQIIKNQVIQYHNIKNTYEAKSMLEISEFIVKEQIENDSLKTGGVIRFSNGEVEVKVASEEQVHLEAILTNDFTSSKLLSNMLSTIEGDPDSEKKEENKTAKKEPSSTESISEPTKEKLPKRK